MENYGWITALMSLAGFMISIPAGVIYAFCKRTLKYTWLFGCIAGFCFFTVFFHSIILVDYDDISSPNYEIYKDWNMGRMILSDILRMIIWLGIGAINYLAFIKRQKIIRRLCIWGMWITFILVFLMVALSKVSLISVEGW